MSPSFQIGVMNASSYTKLKSPTTSTPTSPVIKHIFDQGLQKYKGEIKDWKIFLENDHFYNPFKHGYLHAFCKQIFGFKLFGFKNKEDFEEGTRYFKSRQVYLQEKEDRCKREKKKGKQESNIKSKVKALSQWSERGKSDFLAGIQAFANKIQKDENTNVKDKSNEFVFGFVQALLAHQNGCSFIGHPTNIDENSEDLQKCYETGLGKSVPYFDIDILTPSTMEINYMQYINALKIVNAPNDVKLDVYVPGEEKLDVYVPEEKLDVYEPEEKLDVYVPEEILDVKLPEEVKLPEDVKLPEEVKLHDDAFEVVFNNFISISEVESDVPGNKMVNFIESHMNAENVQVASIQKNKVYTFTTSDIETFSLWKIQPLTNFAKISIDNYKVSETKNDILESNVPSEDSNIYPLWQFIAKRGLFEFLRNCGAKNQNLNIWFILRWCYFDGIEFALQKKDQFEQDLTLKWTEIQKRNFALIDLLDGIFKNLLGALQEALVFLPFRDVNDEEVKYLLKIHQGCTLFGFSNLKFTFNSAVYSNDEFSFSEDFFLSSTSKIDTFFRLCNMYKADRVVKSNFLKEYPLSKDYKMEGIPESKDIFSVFNLQNLSWENFAEQMQFRFNFPERANWVGPKIEHGVVDTNKQNQILDKFSSLDYCKGGMFLYFLNHLDLSQSKPILARYDILNIICSKFDLAIDGLMTYRYKDMVRNAIENFKSTPVVFGGYDSSSKESILIQFMSDNPRFIFQNFVAFRIMYRLYLCLFIPAKDRIKFLSEKIANDLNAKKIIKNISDTCKSTRVEFNEGDIQELAFFRFFRDYTTNIGQIFKLNFKASDLLQIFSFFIQPNTIDVIVFIQSIPILKQFQNQIILNIDNTLGVQKNSNFLSRRDILENDFRTQFKRDGYDINAFERFWSAFALEMTTKVKDINISDMMRHLLKKTTFNYRDYFEDILSNFRVDKSVSSFLIEQAQQIKLCGALYPTITIYGENACSINKEWMLQKFDVSNTWLKGLVDNIVVMLKKGFWSCTDGQELERASHILRWFGFKYMQQVNYLYDLKEWKHVDPNVKHVMQMIKYITMSPSIFPFMTKDFAQSLLDISQQKNLAICRLSTYQPLCLVFQTQKSEIEIPFQQWNTTMSNMKDKSNPFQDKIKSNNFRGCQWVLRTIADRNEVFLFRNLTIVQSDARKCNDNFIVDNSYLLEKEFGFNSLEEEMDFVSQSLKPEYKEKWKQIIFNTLKANRNNSDMNRVIKSKDCESPRAVDYGKGSRSTKVRDDQSLFTSRIATKIGFGDFSGDYDCVDTSDDNNRFWMITKQPFMSVEDLQQVKIQYESNKLPVFYIQLVQNVWSILDDIIGPKWCHNNSYQGNRNKTLLTNWLGPDTLTYILKPGFLNKPKNTEDKDLLEKWQTVYSLSELMRCDYFYPFLNPYDQELLAYQHLELS